MPSVKPFGALAREDGDKDLKGDLCDTDTKPPEPSDDPGVFPCPAAVQTTEAGAWSLLEQRGNKPSCCPLVPVYDYLCRYGRPAGVATAYPESVAYALHCSNVPRSGLGCGYPPTNPDSEMGSATHCAYVANPHGSIAFTPESTFYDELSAIGARLLTVLEQGSDQSGRGVLPAGAAPCP